MINFDSNAWYKLTESRVDFNTTLQESGAAVFLAPAAAGGVENWQLFQLDNGNFQIRNRNVGLERQLATCYIPDETDPSRTRPCLLPAVGDDTQKWLINPWGDGTYYLVNVANGSSYYLDGHPNSLLFMSSTIAEQPKQPGQHWEFSSVAAINDGAYSSTVTTLVSLGYRDFRPYTKLINASQVQRPSPQSQSQP